MVPDSLAGCEQHRLDLADAAALHPALRGADALVIATGARPSVDLTGPMRVDAWGVQHQVASCRRLGLKRVVLVSSLCAGRWSGPDSQESDSIPRRLVARCCLEALNTPASIGRILEVTSAPELPLVRLETVLAG